MQTLLVPLRSISINRNGAKDALVLFRQSGTAVEFTPGELAWLTEDNDGTLDGLLREPTPEELPIAYQEEPLVVAPSDEGEPLPPIDELNALADANVAAQVDEEEAE